MLSLRHNNLNNKQIFGKSAWCWCRDRLHAFTSALHDLTEQVCLSLWEHFPRMSSPIDPQRDMTDSKRKVLVQRVKATVLRQRRVLKLAVCVVQMQDLKIQLGHEALESLDWIQNFNTLCVGVVTHFERSGHSGGHPSPEEKHTVGWMQLSLLTTKCH